MNKKNKCCKNSKGGLTVDVSVNVANIVLCCCITAVVIVAAALFSKTYIKQLEISAKKDI